MTTDDNSAQSWESEMGDAFERRVRDLHEAPLDLGAVKGRAGQIRRRRRAAVAGAVLAAAAVIVPVAVLAGGPAGGRADGVDPAQRPSMSVTDGARVPGDPGTLAIGYLEQRTYHRVDGTSVVLPRRYQSATAGGTDVLASGYDEQSQQVVVDAVDAEGEVVDSFGVLASPVSDRGGELAAYVGLEGDLVVRWEGGEATLASDLTENTRVVAVTGGPTCEPGSGCRVYLDDDAVDDGLRVVSADGAVAPVSDEVLALRGVSENGIAAVLRSVPGDLESCGGLYDVDAGRYVLESCDYSFLGVSPGGQLADTTHPYLDGFGNGWAAIVDRDGREVARHTPEGGVVTDQAWQDEAHLLIVTYTDATQAWTIIRLGTDGSEEVVAGPLRAPMDSYAFRLG